MKKLEMKQMETFVATSDIETYCTLTTRNPFARMGCIIKSGGKGDTNDTLCDFFGLPIIVLGVPPGLLNSFNGVC